MPARIQLAVVGGGPAGLRAAEVAAAAGLRVTLFDTMPSPGRKFLVAGKGGLNLTTNEAPGRMAVCYSGPDQPEGIWHDLLADFDSAALRSWAKKLGVETFQASNRRIYPKSLKAAPLLRAWIKRLRALGVHFEMNRRWTSLQPGSPHQLEFSNGAVFEADAVVLALGGASWPQTGSDGRWLPRFESLGIRCHPLVPANCGWNHPWPNEFLADADGQPLKNIHASAGDTRVAGELLVTRNGLEGGAIYQLGPALRAMPRPAIAIDLKPTFSHDQLVGKMLTVRRGFLAEARIRWRLGTAAHALLARTEWHDANSLAREAKHCVIPLDGPRPIAEAISSAGGVCWSALDATLMLRQCPGVFVAGEMIDWEAPTGGFLMQGCFATGTRAAHGAAAWLARRIVDC
jgi:uncharacterized flavoprotein (TIGR03862 family)